MTREEFLTSETIKEISGFGGEYEKACRRMLLAGLEWLDNNPDAILKLLVYRNIYGIVEEDNDDTKQLSSVVENAVPGCSGAMHQAVMQTLCWIKTHSWDEYINHMLK